MMFPYYNLTTAGCLAEAGKPGQSVTSAGCQRNPKRAWLSQGDWARRLPHIYQPVSVLQCMKKNMFPYYNLTTAGWLAEAGKLGQSVTSAGCQRNPKCMWLSQGDWA